MLAIINRIVLEAASAPSIVDALSLIVEHIQETLGADACSIFLNDDERGDYVLLATDGLNKNLVGKARVKYGEGLIGLVGEREEPVNVEDALLHSNYHQYPKLETQEYPSFLGIPMIHRAALQGVLVVQQVESRLFAEEEVAFLVTLTTQLGGEIASARAKGYLNEVFLGKKRKRKKDRVLVGVSGAQGVAIGKAVVVYPPADLDAVPDQPASDVSKEIEIFEAALALARE